MGTFISTTCPKVKLSPSLDAVVENCVKRGSVVDVNTAIDALLTGYVPREGACVADPSAPGRRWAFRTRRALNEGGALLGPKAFSSRCARVPAQSAAATTRLDASSVHPERTPGAPPKPGHAGSAMPEPDRETKQRCAALPAEQLHRRGFLGRADVSDILREAGEKPGPDRGRVPTATFSEAWKNSGAPAPGMVLAALFTNVAAFGGCRHRVPSGTAWCTVADVRATTFGPPGDDFPVDVRPVKGASRNTARKRIC